MAAKAVQAELGKAPVLPWGPHQHWTPLSEKCTLEGPCPYYTKSHQLGKWVWVSTVRERLAPCPKQSPHRGGWPWHGPILVAVSQSQEETPELSPKLLNPGLE